MRVTNADGSRPEMCGNGLRCVALHLSTLDGLTHSSQIIDTDAGPRQCDAERNGLSARVRATMGVAQPLEELAVEVDGRALSFARLSLGNPHAVIFEAAFDEQQIDKISEQVSRAIRGGSNVEFVTQRDDRLDVVVWERGVGRTRACGTGAVASVAVAALANRVPFGELVTVRLPGGVLSVSVDQASLSTALVGPARRVFEGTFSP
jgi:diaminopimelate epimerase